MSLELIDTHCHIQSAGIDHGERATREIWAKDPTLQASNLWQSARSAGVSNIVCVGCDLADSRLAIDFAAEHEGVVASIGLHPHEAQHYADDDQARQVFGALITNPKVVAVGECGLDYFYEHSPKADQVNVLRFQIELALEHDLPLIFHVREAFDDFWPIFNDYPGLRGVLHSFTDSTINVERAVAAGLYIGVNGIATFAKKAEQRAMYASIPLTNLVLETDAPFLTPTPYRGSINEPKHVLTVASFLSELYGIETSQLAASTTANAKQLFGLK